jgi:hypothetical protein
MIFWSRSKKKHLKNGVPWSFLANHKNTEPEKKSAEPKRKTKQDKQNQMAGYYGNIKFDAGSQDYQAYKMYEAANYFMNLNAYYRKEAIPHPLSVVSQPSFWGPLRGSLVTKESFLQGRGQALADTPASETIYLPESLDWNHANYTVPCQETSLEPLQTRMRRSCTGDLEYDPSPFQMFPGAFQEGYTGPYSGVNGNLQTRMGPYDPTLMAGAQAMNNCQNYGNYGAVRTLEPYTL